MIKKYKFIICSFLLVLLILLLLFKCNKSTRMYENMTSRITYTGGCTMKNDKLYSFTSSGTFTIANNEIVKLLVVGGGGGGGAGAYGGYNGYNMEGGGGGGGGGVGFGTLTLTAGTYNIVVGEGGNAGDDGKTTSIIGGNINETANGGGGGGSNTPNLSSGHNGGSGGGNCAGWQQYGIGSATKGAGKLQYYGNNGGVGQWKGGGGGGGGSGGVGASVSNSGGKGGDGMKFEINDAYYGAGGGGGGSFVNGHNGGAGGNGGGGNGANINGANSAIDGVPNTGSGGGGNTNRSIVGGKGGSGVVNILIVSPPSLPVDYSADFNIYTVLDHNQVLLQPQNRLSCTSNDCKASKNCMNIKLCKNMAISFQITLNKPNSTDNFQQILGITNDPCGSDKRAFGVFFGGPSKSSIYLDTSINNGATTADYSANNIKNIATFESKIGKNMRVDVLCNFNQQSHQTYVDGVLIETKTFYENSFFPTGNAYIFTSFNEFSNADGNIHDVVVLTSDFRTFKVEELVNATTYMDTKLKNVESFTGSYNPLDDGSYSIKDIRSMETEILNQLNSFNQGYSNYIKYMYNQRHNQTGDTSIKLTLTDNSGNKIDDADFSKNMHFYEKMDESDTYKILMKDLELFNEALKYNAQVDISYNGPVMNLDSMKKQHNELVNIRMDLDNQLSELNETEGTLYMQNYNDNRGQTLKNILLTTLATSLVYYVFLHMS